MSRARLSAGLVLTTTMLAVALLSLIWTPFPPDAIDMSRRLAGPSATHWLGCDQLGRDVLSRLMAGARSAWLVGLVAVGLGLLGGTDMALNIV